MCAENYGYELVNKTIPAGRGFFFSQGLLKRVATKRPQMVQRSSSKGTAIPTMSPLLARSLCLNLSTVAMSCGRLALLYLLQPKALPARTRNTYLADSFRPETVHLDSPFE